MIKLLLLLILAAIAWPLALVAAVLWLAVKLLALTGRATVFGLSLGARSAKAMAESSVVKPIPLRPLSEDVHRHPRG